jgi:hypothetical protein
MVFGDADGGGLVTGDLDSSMMWPPLSVEKTILWATFLMLHTMSYSATCFTRFVDTLIFFIYDTEKLHQCYICVPVMFDKLEKMLDVVHRNIPKWFNIFENITFT